MAAFAIPLTFALLVAAVPMRAMAGELHVHVQPWREDLEGTPVFLESAAGTRLAPLDRKGIAQVTGLAAGDYRITLPRAPGTVVCRWSPECGPVRVGEGAVVVAVLYVLRPSAVSSSSLRIPEG